MLTPKKDYFTNLFSGVGRVVAKFPIHPNAITLFGLFLCAVVCIYLLITRNLFIFCFLVGGVAFFDLLDGVVARISGKTSRFGSYLDAMTDRFFDGLVIISVASVTGFWVLSIIFLFLSMSVSYAKARAGMEVKISNNEWPDFLERSERIFLYLLGLLLSQIFLVTFLDHGIFWWTLLLLNIGVGVTVVQRIVRARRFLAERD
jgi:archaetidylinositol phosphate synthase